MKKYLYILMALIIVGCPDEDDIPIPVDPCLNSKPVSADFHIYESSFSPLNFRGNWIYYDTDTLATSNIIFKALEEDAEYEWHLGSEVIYQKEFGRANFPRNQFLDVTLIVRKKPDLKCNPDDDGIDTLTRKFLVIGNTNDCLDIDNISGTYTGYDFGDTLYRDVVIDVCKYDSIYEEKRLSITNLFIGSELNRFEDGFVGYKQIYFSVIDNKVLNIRGLIKSKENFSKVEIVYSYQKTASNEDRDNRISKTFNGVRK